MPRVVFLDIDGVLNRDQEESNEPPVDEDKVALLSAIVKRTGAKIVLSSGWKYEFDENCAPIGVNAKRLVNILAKYNVSIADKTPDLAGEEILKSRRFSMIKAKEIKLWLHMHSEVMNWVVIDDLDLGDSEIAAHQIKPDKGFGLTYKDMERGLSCLGYDV